MTETRIQRLSEISLSSGLPESYATPIEPQWFAGKHEGRLGQLAESTHFGVNYVRLDPGAYSSLRHWHTGEGPGYHVHVVARTAPLFSNLLASRDTLRANPSKRVEYLELKKKLAGLHASDVDAYTVAKGPYIEAELKGPLRGKIRETERGP